MRYHACIVVIMVVLSFGTVAAQPADPSAAAIAWIQGQQQPDGSFPGFGPGDTADTVLAFVAAGIDPGGMKKAGKSPLDYLASQASTYSATSVGAASKLALAATAAGSDPRALGGVDLAALIGNKYDTITGQYGGDVTGHCLALLAVRAMGATPPDAALTRTEQLQLADGGWGFDGKAATGSDTNTTALCAQGLVAAGRVGAATSKALTYLQRQQNADGGFPFSQTSQYGNASDANSTALAIQGLAALGADTAGGVKALASLQNPSGAFRFQASQPDDNALATYQAVAGLLAKPLPLRVGAVAGAQSVIAPSSASPTLPATGTPGELFPAVALAALMLMSCGALLRWRGQK